MKTTTINIGDTVEIVNVHPQDAHINSSIFRPGARGVVLTRPYENIKGYFAGDIEFIKGNPRFFFAVKIKKVEAKQPEPKPAPQPGDNSLRSKIMSAILEVYQTLPDEFHAQYLFVPVRSKIFKQTRKHPFAETILRYFRQLRSDGVINCDCTNRQKSLYIKTETK